MEVTFCKRVIRAHIGLSEQYKDFYVQAIGKFEGYTLYYGSYTPGCCDTIIEGSTYVRCGYPTVKMEKLRLDQAIEQLTQDLYDNIRKSGVSFDEVVEHFNRTMLPLPKTFITLWRISLLIGC